MLEGTGAKKEPVAAIACNCIPGQCQCTMNERRINHEKIYHIGRE